MNKVEMLTDKEYNQITKKIIYANCSNGVANMVYKDPILFGTVVSSVMEADWEWNGSGTIFGFRKKKAQWCILTILRNLKTKTGKHTTKAFSVLCEDNNWDNIEGMKLQHSINEVDESDYKEYVVDKIDRSEIMTDTEKAIIKGRILEGKTVKCMSEELNIAGQAIRETLKRAVKKVGQSLCIT